MSRFDLSRARLESSGPNTDGLEAVTIDVSPGNGTRYRLAVVMDGQICRSVSWPDVAWSAGDFHLPVAAEWLASRSKAVNIADGLAIAAILNELVGY